jgi:hypothetical protein
MPPWPAEDDWHMATAEDEARQPGRRPAWDQARAGSLCRAFSATQCIYTRARTRRPRLRADRYVAADELGRPVHPER